jgi:EAL domain-containing protein (putative c-di-GMP-specific phosphodiesterase class I)/PAS domain-containing protein
VSKDGSAVGYSEALPRYLGYIFASSDLVFEIDDGGRVHNVMGAASLLTGRDPAVLEGQAWRGLFPQQDRDLVKHLLDAIRPGERKGPIRIRLNNTADGRAPPPALGLSMFQAASGRPVSVSLSISSVPDIPRVPSSANGMLTPAELEENLSTLLTQVRSDGGRVQVEMLELGGLTSGMAQLGPQDRERMAQRVRARLRAASVRGGSAVEVGEERFVILTDRTPQPGDLGHALEQLGAEFGVALSAQQETVPLSEELTPDQTVRALKVALDIFTHEGVANAAQTLREVIDSTSAKSRKICEIIKQDSFELLFQPIIDFALGGVHHYEALARLGGTVESPAESMRLAEELAIVDKFDHAVAVQAIRALKEADDEALRIAINVSPFTFMKPGYAVWLLSQLNEQGVSPRQLLVELTETVPIKDFETARSRIEHLRDAGVKFCLDDVGSGAASLDYLRQLPFDYVKLDGRFVADLTTDKRSQLLIESMVTMCRALGGAVIAEQIETDDVASLLKAADVSLGQGWLFGRPAALPPPEPKGQRPSGTSATH